MATLFWLAVVIFLIWNLHRDKAKSVIGRVLSFFVACFGMALLGVLWVGVPLAALWGFVALVKLMWVNS